jgi:hypothetical protein
LHKKVNDIFFVNTPQKILKALLSEFFIQAAVGVPRSELAELWGFP